MKYQLSDVELRFVRFKQHLKGFERMPSVAIRIFLGEQSEKPKNCNSCENKLQENKTNEFAETHHSYQ